MSPGNRNVHHHQICAAVTETCHQQSPLKELQSIQENIIPFQVPFKDNDDQNASSKSSINDHHQTESATSTLNSHSSDYNNTDNNSITRSHHSRSASKESLTNRLSRGFFDFTQGSSDRLQKWKNKLQYGRRHKDSSEPPPITRYHFIYYLQMFF